jgi:hypothetical protein
MLPTIAMSFSARMWSSVMTSLLPVAVTRCRRAARRLQRHDLEAVHGRLQGADRIDLGDHHAGAGALERLGGALADVAIAADDGDLAGHHHVGAAADAVDQRFTAAVLVVELRLGDAVVDVDRRERQRALLLQLIEAVDAGGGLFGHALDGVALLDEPARVGAMRFLIWAKRILLFLESGSREDVSPASARAPSRMYIVASPPSSRIMLTGRHRPTRRSVGVVPVFFQRLALDGEDRDAGGGDGRGGVVLGGEDVAGRPADVGAERLQRLDQNRGLDRHVQRAGDARALERLRSPNSSRQAIRPGISVSAISISVRP